MTTNGLKLPENTIITPMHHLESFKWKPGTQSPNPNGRPLKLATILKRNGITQTQCNDLILQILSMTRNEIQSIALDETAPMIERIISNALLKSHQQSNLYALESLLNRTFGTPKQTTFSNQITEKPIFVSLNLDIPNT
jgi:hypothetical protein